MLFLASEKLSPHKFKTPEGYLICTDVILSRTGKQDYRRCELFGDACENPDEIVQVDRTANEVFSDKTMASFENKAVCIEHPDEDVSVENHNDLSVGFVRDIHKGEYEGEPVMMGTLVITDKDAVEAIESGEYKELSCGYLCDVEDDKHPQQKNIRGNHVALCKQGRAGIARIIDSVDDAGIKVWQVHQGYAIVVERYWKQYGKNAYVDGVESNIDSARYRRGSLERNDKIRFIIIDCNDNKYRVIDSKMNEGEKDMGKNTLTEDAKVVGWRIRKEGNLYVVYAEEVKLLRGAGYGSKEDAERYIHMVDKNPKIVYDNTTHDSKWLIEQRERGRFTLFKETIDKYGEENWTVYEDDFRSVEQAKAYARSADRNADIIVDSTNMKKTSDDDWTKVEEENYKKANNIKIDGVKDADYKVVSVGSFNKPMVIKNKYTGKYEVLAPNYNTLTFEQLKRIAIKYNVDLEYERDFGTAIIKSKNKDALYRALAEIEPNFFVGSWKIVDNMKKDSLYTISYKKNGKTFVRKVRAANVEDAISKANKE